MVQALVQVRQVWWSVQLRQVVLTPCHLCAHLLIVVALALDLLLHCPRSLPGAPQILALTMPLLRSCRASFTLMQVFWSHQLASIIGRLVALHQVR
jgi:hypothetical protein